MAISLKSDAFNTFLSALSLPSAVLFFLLTGSVISSYSFFLDTGTDYIPGLILIGAALILSVISAKKYIHIQSASCSGKLLRTTLFYFVMATATAYSICSIKDIIRFRSIDTQKKFHAKVTDIIQKRYSDEIILESLSPSGAVTLTGRLALSRLRIGDEIEICGGVQRSQPDSPYRLSLARRGIYHAVDLEENFTLKKKSSFDIRTRIRETISLSCDTILSARASGLIKGMYFGSSSFVDKETTIAFRKAGISHILSASGFNVAIITFIPLFTLAAAGIKRRYALLLVLPPLLFYFFITDMPVSLLRAVIMFAVFSIQILLGIEKNIINALFIAGSIIILLFPYEIYSLGFQLSFGATLGIILFYKKYAASLFFLPNLIRSSVAITLSAQIITIPLIAFSLSEINISGLCTNIVSVPLTSLLMNLSIAANVLFVFIPEAGGIIGEAVNQLFNAHTFFVDLMARTGGHLIIESVSVPLLLLFAGLAFPLVPANPFKKVSSAGIIVFAAGTMLLYADRGKEREMVKISDDSGSAYLFREGKKCVVSGTISSTVAVTLIREIEKSPMSIVTLYVKNPDYKNISACRMIVKNSLVKECVLSSHHSFGKHMRFFFDHLERDRIHLKIMNFETLQKNELPADPLEKYALIDNKIIDSCQGNFNHYSEKKVIGN